MISILKQKKKIKIQQQENKIQYLILKLTGHTDIYNCCYCCFIIIIFNKTFNKRKINFFKNGLKAKKIKTQNQNYEFFFVYKEMMINCLAFV